MPAAHPRRPWRLTWAKALSVTVLAGVTGWSESSHAGKAADKVDWLFSHMHRVARAHLAALLFGQGSDTSTTAETDGGFLYKKTIRYQKSGGTRLE